MLKLKLIKFNEIICRHSINRAYISVNDNTPNLLIFNNINEWKLESISIILVPDEVLKELKFNIINE